MAIGSGYVGAGGQRFMSSVLAESSMRPSYSSSSSYGGSRSSGSSTFMTPTAMNLWKDAIAQYAPGGSFGKGVEASLARGRTKSVASGMQSLVASGLANTTQAAGLGKKFEEEVGAPTRLRVESQRAQAIAGLKSGYAQAYQGAFEREQGRYLGDQASRRSSAVPYSMPQQYQEPRQATAPSAPKPYYGKVKSPFGGGGGYSPPMAGWGGGSMSPVAGQAPIADQMIDKYKMFNTR